MDNGKWIMENWAESFKKKIVNSQFSIVNSTAYTLIELLVVIAIIGILSLVGFVNFKSFSADQVAVKAAGQIQSYLRLTQTNASTSTKCPVPPPATDQGAISWYLVFSGNTINVECDTTATPGVLYRTYTLDSNVQVTNACSNPIIYTIGSGTLPSTVSDCTITVKNSSSATAAIKTISVTKGGAISVQ